MRAHESWGKNKKISLISIAQYSGPIHLYTDLVFSALVYFAINTEYMNMSRAHFIILADEKLYTPIDR